MIYIKQFEAYHPDDDKYYTLLENNEPSSLLIHSIQMNRDEYIRISELYPIGYICEVDLIYITDDQSRRSVSILKAKRPGAGGCIMRIFKLPDEWYLLSMSDIKEGGTIYFKVDQFEGLEYMLNKLCVKPAKSKSKSIRFKR